MKKLLLASMAVLALGVAAPAFAQSQPDRTAAPLSAAPPAAPAARPSASSLGGPIGAVIGGFAGAVIGAEAGVAATTVQYAGDQPGRADLSR